MIKEPAIRRIAKVYDIKIENVGDEHFDLILSGASANGKRGGVGGKIPWGFVPFVLRDLKKKWEAEKSKRLGVIATIDQSFKEASS